MKDKFGLDGKMFNTVVKERIDDYRVIGTGLRRYNLNCKWHGNKVKTDV